MEIIAIEKDDVQESEDRFCPAVSREVSGLMRYAANKPGFTHLFMGLRRDEETIGTGAEEIMECRSITLINPIIEFSETDVWEYANRNYLPVCSVYNEKRGKIGCLSSKMRYVPVEISKENEDEALINERLRSLGYL